MSVVGRSLRAMDVSHGWSEWRGDWAAQKADGTACPLCRIVVEEDRRWGLLVFDGQFVNGYLWRPGSVPGYCVAIWKQGHVVEPTELDEPSASGFWLEVLRLGRALETLYRPAKMNYQTLGNVVPHLHTHLVPRHWADPAPHAPLPWSYLDDGLQSDDVLVPAAQRLRALLAEST